MNIMLRVTAIALCLLAGHDVIETFLLVIAVSAVVYGIRAYRTV